MAVTVDQVLESLIRNVYDVFENGTEDYLVEGTLDAFCTDFISLHESMLAGDVPTLWRTNGPE